MYEGARFYLEPTGQFFRVTKIWDDRLLVEIRFEQSGDRKVCPWPEDEIWFHATRTLDAL